MRDKQLQLGDLHWCCKLRGKVYRIQSKQAEENSCDYKYTVGVWCIVLSLSIKLQEWLLQADIDWLLSDQIATLYCIARIVRDLHAKDLVLCDLSPTTIAWYITSWILKFSVFFIP